MTDYLLDTNVISELTKPRPRAEVIGWLRGAGDCYLSVLTIGELERGVWALRPRSAERAEAIATWIAQLRHDYADRILTVDLQVAAAWAARPTTRTVPVVDALIAATASAHGLTVVTRNTSDFAELGVAVIDPFEG